MLPTFIVLSDSPCCFLSECISQRYTGNHASNREREQEKEKEKTTASFSEEFGALLQSVDNVIVCVNASVLQTIA